MQNTVNLDFLCYQPFSVTVILSGFKNKGAAIADHFWNMPIAWLLCNSSNFIATDLKIKQIRKIISPYLNTLQEKVIEAKVVTMRARQLAFSQAGFSSGSPHAALMFL